MAVRKAPFLVPLVLLVFALAVLGDSRPASAEVATDPGRCDLPPNAVLGEGMGPGRGLPSSGTIRVAMIFVDFPDATATTAAQARYDATIPPLIDWYRSISRGRLTLSVTPHAQWLRLTKSVAAYRDAKDPTLISPRPLLAEAVAAADPFVDFSKYDMVYVAIPTGLTNSSVESFGALDADGVRITRGVLSVDTKYQVLAHETGHALGLPDLYDAGAASPKSVAGWWDIMSDSSSANHNRVTMTAWHRWKLGWLDPSEVQCLLTGTVDATLVPVTSTASGTRAVIVPVSAKQNYVVEARDKIGEDQDICTAGVLIYLVDQGSPPAAAPGGIQVVRSATTPSDRSLEARCGPKYDAPFTANGVATFTDTTLGVSVQVLGSSGGSFNVRVTGPTTAQPARPKASATSAGAGAGGFISPPNFGTSAVATAVFGGGSLDQLEATAQRAGAGGVWLQDSSGSFQLLIVGSPAFLKDGVKNAFPNGVPAFTAVTLTRRR